MLLAYYIRDLQTLQLALYCPLFLNLMILLFVKESTRWLLAKGKVNQARRNVEHMARVNRKELPQANHIRFEFWRFQAKSGIITKKSPTLKRSQVN